MQRNIILTEDGSSSIFVPELNESYHSIHGAIQESNHVFIKSGLKALNKRNINILEIGYGSGLNAILSYKTAIELGLTINYTGLEAFPLTEAELKLLNYNSIAELQSFSEIFNRLNAAIWNDMIAIDKNISLLKMKIKLEDFIPQATTYDLIYFDAFSPNIQPELWTESIIQKLYLGMKIGGVFVTYCAKGKVRRTLQTAGFIVERLQGPPGKREMLRAIKSR